MPTQSDEPAPDLKTVLANFQAATKIHRTSNQIGNSRWPYYTEHYASEILEIFQRVVATKVPYFWTSEVLTVNTLKARYRQGIKYALANMEDTNNPWVRPLVDAVQVRELAGGIRFFPNLARTDLTAVDTRWRQDFEDFISRSEVGSVFERFTALTKDEQDWLMNFLTGIKDFVSHNQPNNKHIRVQILE